MPTLGGSLKMQKGGGANCYKPTETWRQALQLFVALRLQNWNNELHFWFWSPNLLTYPHYSQQWSQGLTLCTKQEAGQISKWNKKWWERTSHFCAIDSLTTSVSPDVWATYWICIYRESMFTSSSPSIYKDQCRLSLPESCFLYFVETYFQLKTKFLQMQLNTDVSILTCYCWVIIYTILVQTTAA